MLLILSIFVKTIVKVLGEVETEIWKVFGGFILEG